MSGDIHSPTPTVPPADATFGAPAGSAAPASGPGGAESRPEKLVGAAFAGGLVAALFLKRLGR
jgi:hypothetical protein